jgi:hypothetical protein
VSQYIESSGGTEAFPSRLVIAYMNREYVITPERPFTIGSAGDADLQISGAWVSGQHARIECAGVNRRFELVDHSANGTLVQSEDDVVRRIHRDRVAMWGEGWLGIGAPLAADTALRYSHV